MDADPGVEPGNSLAYETEMAPTDPRFIHVLPNFPHSALKIFQLLVYHCYLVSITKQFDYLNQ